MIMPNGKLPEHSSGAIGLALLADFIDQQKKLGLYPEIPEVILACVGSPTFPADVKTALAAKSYWDNIANRAILASRCYQQGKELTLANVDQIIAAEGQIDYGDDPTGDIVPRQMVANAINALHGPGLSANENNIIFTVGATSALHAIFNLVNTVYPNRYIVTPFPYYWIYEGKSGANKLHPIKVMDEPGYRLTARALQKSIDAAKSQGKEIGAFLFCDPNNPIGSVVGKEEWQKIAGILGNYSVPIILDNCYAEMQHNGEKYVSLLEVAPELKSLIITVYSSTKGFSLAGERPAFIAMFNPQYHAYLKHEVTTNYIHAPRSLQIAYATGFSQFGLDQRKVLGQFYHLQSDYIFKHLNRLGLNMPDKTYCPQATFYVLGDFSEFLGLTLPENSAIAVDLNKNNQVTDDVRISLYLLFTCGIALAPMSHFGLNRQKGYLRLTCSNTSKLLFEMVSRLEEKVLEIRKAKFNSLVDKISNLLSSLFDPTIKTKITQRYLALIDTQNISAPEMALYLKLTNEKLTTLLKTMTPHTTTHISMWHRPNKTPPLLDHDESPLLSAKL